MDPTSPGWQQTFEQLRAMPEYDALSDAELREALLDQSEQAEEWQGVTFDPQATNNFFLEQEEAFGSDWNEGDANKRFRQLIKGHRSRFARNCRSGGELCERTSVVSRTASWIAQ